MELVPEMEDETTTKRKELLKTIAEAEAAAAKLREANTTPTEVESTTKFESDDVVPTIDNDTITTPEFSNLEAKFRAMSEYELAIYKPSKKEHKAWEQEYRARGNFVTSHPPLIGSLKYQKDNIVRYREDSYLVHEGTPYQVSDRQAKKNKLNRYETILIVDKQGRQSFINRANIWTPENEVRELEEKAREVLEKLVAEPTESQIAAMVNGQPLPDWLIDAWQSAKESLRQRGTAPSAKAVIESASTIPANERAQTLKEDIGRKIDTAKQATETAQTAEILPVSPGRLEIAVQNILRENKKVKSIRNLKIEPGPSSDTLTLNAEITVGSWGIKSQVTLEAILINEGDNIKVHEGYALSATKSEEKIKSLFAENIDSIGAKLKEYIEKREQRQVERVEIKNGQLEITLSMTPPAQEKVVRQKMSEIGLDEESRLRQRIQMRADKKRESYEKKNTLLYFTKAWKEASKANSEFKPWSTLALAYGKLIPAAVSSIVASPVRIYQILRSLPERTRNRFQNWKDTRRLRKLSKFKRH